MVSNQFFDKKGPFPLREIIKTINCSGDFTDVADFEIYGVESLINAKINDQKVIPIISGWPIPQNIRIPDNTTILFITMITSNLLKSKNSSTKEMLILK